MSELATQDGDDLANNGQTNIVWLTKEELRSYMEGASLEHIFEQRDNDLKKLQEGLA